VNGCVVDGRVVDGRVVDGRVVDGRVASSSVVRGDLRSSRTTPMPKHVEATIHNQ
jgi:hypothetical protein